MSPEVNGLSIVLLHSGLDFLLLIVIPTLDSLHSKLAVLPLQVVSRLGKKLFAHLVFHCHHYFEVLLVASLLELLLAVLLSCLHLDVHVSPVLGAVFFHLPALMGLLSLLLLELSEPLVGDEPLLEQLVLLVLDQRLVLDFDVLDLFRLLHGELLALALLLISSALELHFLLVSYSFLGEVLALGLFQDVLLSSLGFRDSFLFFLTLLIVHLVSISALLFKVDLPFLVPSVHVFPARERFSFFGSLFLSVLALEVNELLSLDLVPSLGLYARHVLLLGLLLSEELVLGKRLVFDHLGHQLLSKSSLSSPFFVSLLLHLLLCVPFPYFILSFGFALLFLELLLLVSLSYLLVASLLLHHGFYFFLLTNLDLFEGSLFILNHGALCVVLRTGIPALAFYG